MAFCFQAFGVMVHSALAQQPVQPQADETKAQAGCCNYDRAYSACLEGCGYQVR